MNQRTRAYAESRQDRLDMLKAMWKDPFVQCYSDKDLPSKDERNSIFLAGPTSRSQSLESNWRCEAVMRLRAYGFDGHIFVPEPRGEADHSDFTEKEQVYLWESSRLMSADFVVFWIPRNASDLVGLNTNLELGIFLGKAMSRNLEPQRLFIGWPVNAERMGLPDHYTKMAKQKIFHDLEEFCDLVAQNKV